MYKANIMNQIESRDIYRQYVEYKSCICIDRHNIKGTPLHEISRSSKLLDLTLYVQYSNFNFEFPSATFITTYTTTANMKMQNIWSQLNFSNMYIYIKIQRR